MMLPFANAGRWYRPGEKKPAPDSSRVAYAIWLRDASGIPPHP
jgi:hypothetical protein